MTTPEPPTPGGNGLGATLKGIPQRTWIILLVVGAGIGLYLRSRGGSVEAVPEENPGVGVGGGGFTAVAPGGVAYSPPAIADNNAWGSAATSSLSSQNFDPAMADEAVRRYLDGLSLSPAQWAMISKAIQTVGPTPDVLPAGPAIPTTTPTSTVTPSKPSTVSTPKAPTGLKATTVDKTRVILSWGSVSGVKGYELFMGGKKYKDSLDNTVHAYPLKAGTKYSFSVRAIGTTGVPSPQSGTITVTTKK